MPNLRPARIAGIVILVLLVGSNFVLPAGAHITKRLPHLQRHLDPRYVNVNETTSLMTGPGKVIEGAATVAVNSSNFVLTETGFFAVEYQCLASPNPGFVVFHNLTNASVTDLFIDDGSGANPQYWDSTPNSSVSNPAAAAGDFYTFQAQAPNVGVATIHVTSRNPGGNCDVQAQAVISS
jgi:hypothetical protein